MAKKVKRGSVFQRVYRDRGGKLKHTRRWYVKYYANGKPVTLPAETEDYDEALTNMIEAGLSEKEAMEISGHRTRAVFDRYHIVSERRLREMAGKIEAHLKSKEQATVSDSGVRRPS